MRLISPTPTFYLPFIEMARDFVRAGDKSFLKDQSFSFYEFESYIRQLQKDKEGRSASGQKVPQIRYWMVNEKNQIVGLGNLRKDLLSNPKIQEGNIGYKITPRFRRKGYGKLILDLLIREAQKENLPGVLLTCYHSNTPSKRVIEFNGGVLIKSERKLFLRKRVKHYWISFSEKSMPRC